MKQMFLAAAVLSSLVTGCANSAQAPRAQTTPRAAQRADSPYLVSVTLPDLRPPSEIRSDCTTYVAWVRSEDGSLRRAGEVRFDDEGKGRIDLLTQTDRFTLLVTAEPDARADQPSRDALVVRQNVGDTVASTSRASL